MDDAPPFKMTRIAEDDLPGGAEITTILVIIAMAMVTSVGRRFKRAKHHSLDVKFETLMHQIHTPKEFKSCYRLTREEFDALYLDMCRSDCMYATGGGHNRAVDGRLKLLSTLRYCAGGDPKDVRRIHGQSKMTFWRHLITTMKLICKVTKMDFPLDDPVELAKLERNCCAGRSFGGGAYMGNIGFLDGLLIHIRKPDDVPYAGMFWCERKHCFAINCQGICDGDLKLRYFSARCTGSTHDSKAFEYTQLGRRVMLGHDPGGIPAPYHLGGDSAYTSSDAMSVPWGASPVGTPRDNFNFVHSQFRSTIERAFGALIRRFGVFWRPLDHKLATNMLVIRTCVRLHNICMERANGEHVDTQHIGDVGLQPDLAAIKERFLNAYQLPESTLAGGSSRIWLTARIADAGIERHE